MWKPGGNVSLACGSLSAAAAIGGGATGAIFATPGLSGRPCAHGGGAAGAWAAGAGAGAWAAGAGAGAGVAPGAGAATGAGSGVGEAAGAGADGAPAAGPAGDCWAATGPAAAASPAVHATSNKARRHNKIVLMAILPAASLTTRCARSVGHTRK